MATTQTLLASLQKLVTDKVGLRNTERKLRQTEQRLMQQMERALQGFGYKLASLNGREARPGRGVLTRRRALLKKLKCPKCDRRFSMQMHVARHLSAMHLGKRTRTKPRK